MKIHFQADIGGPQEAIVVVADLEGFTQFCNSAIVQQYIAPFLSKVFHELDVLFNGGKLDWLDETEIVPLPVRPSYCKFLGDGGLFIFFAEEGQPFPVSFAEKLLARLAAFHTSFPFLKTHVQDTIRDTDLYPNRIRFGIARGFINRLTRDDGTGDDIEYIGSSINLASRLQGYCKDLGVIASTMVGSPPPIYKRLKALNIRGFDDDTVFVLKDNYTKHQHETQIVQCFMEPDYPDRPDPEDWL